MSSVRSYAPKGSLTAALKTLLAGGGEGVVSESAQARISQAHAQGRVDDAAWDVMTRTFRLSDDDVFRAIRYSTSAAAPYISAAAAGQHLQNRLPLNVIASIQRMSVRAHDDDTQGWITGKLGHLRHTRQLRKQQAQTLRNTVAKRQRLR